MDAVETLPINIVCVFDKLSLESFRDLIEVEKEKESYKIKNFVMFMAREKQPPSIFVTNGENSTTL